MYLMLFVEEKQAIDASYSCALLDFDHEDQGPDSRTRPSPASYRRLDWKYKILEPTPSLPSEYMCGLGARYTFSHFIGILRRVPLKQLYAYSGWYASDQDVSTARTYLVSWMRENPALSRDCVVHAGALLAEIRSTPTTACYHYFCLLVAILYLRAFTTLQPQNSLALEETLFLDSPPAILKVDQHHEPSLREHWVHGGSGVLVHIIGVGMLSNLGSAQRLWKELHRILCSRRGWPTFRKALMMCVSAHLNNSSPMKAIRYSD